MNVRLMKFLDSLLGRLAVTVFPAPITKNTISNIHSILVIRPGGIGDAVHLIPTITALSKALPFVAIDVLAEHRNSAVFSMCQGVRKVYHYDEPRELISVLVKRYDIVIDSEQWHRLSVVVARVISPEIIIGFASNERAKIINYPIPYSHDEYEVDSFTRLIEPLGISSRSIVPNFLSLPAEIINSLPGFLGEIQKTGYITIFPGASIPERRWGAARFRLVADFMTNLGMKVVVVGGKDDQLAGDEIVAGGAGFNLAGKCSLLETAAVIDKSAMLISGDSGVLHIGVGLGKPTVSLFGPGRAQKWAPKGERHIVVNKQLSCSPCTAFGTTPACPFNVGCMNTITVDEVVDAACLLLKRCGVL